MFADLEDLPGGEFIDSFSGDIGCLEQILGPLGAESAFQAGRAASGGRDGQVDLLGGGLADLADDLIGVGRVDRGNRVGGDDILAADMKRVGPAQILPDLGDGLGKGLRGPRLLVKSAKGSLAK